MRITLFHCHWLRHSLMACPTLLSIFFSGDYTYDNSATNNPGSVSHTTAHVEHNIVKTYRLPTEGLCQRHQLLIPVWSGAQLHGTCAVACCCCYGFLLIQGVLAARGVLPSLPAVIVLGPCGHCGPPRCPSCWLEAAMLGRRGGSSQARWKGAWQQAAWRRETPPAGGGRRGHGAGAQLHGVSKKGCYHASGWLDQWYSGSGVLSGVEGGSRSRSEASENVNSKSPYDFTQLQGEVQGEYRSLYKELIGRASASNGLPG